MKRAFKKYFIPHEENNYKPHFLHSKRTYFYGTIFLAMKAVVVVFVMLLPTTVFVMPDVLANEEIKLAGLVNKYRAESGVSSLSGQVKLYGTATDKANDMIGQQYFGHVSPSGRTLADIMAQHDYAYDFAGENLAIGFADASELLGAWIESPTHRNNILDPDFSEYGIVMLAGNFEDEPTVFAVNHFGHPRSVDGKNKFENKAVLPEKIVQTEQTKTEENILVPETIRTTTEILSPLVTTGIENTVSTSIGEIVSSSVGQNILAAYSRENSFVSVMRDNEGGATVSARVFMGVKPARAKIEFGKYTIPLAYDLSDGAMAGEISIAKDDRVSVLTSPVLIVSDSEGGDWNDTVPLRGQVLTTMTPLQKYITARKTLSDLMPVFVFSREVYLGFIVIFSLALIVNIFVEIRKQHPHIILQTSGLLMMLFFL